MCLVGSQICDACSRKIQATYTHRCKACDFDLCGRCFRAKARAASAQAVPHRAALRPLGPAPPPSARGRSRHRQMRAIYGLGAPPELPELMPLPPLVHGGGGGTPLAAPVAAPSSRGAASEEEESRLVGEEEALPEGGYEPPPAPSSARVIVTTPEGVSNRGSLTARGRPITAPSEPHPPQNLPPDEQCRVAIAMLVGHYMSAPTALALKKPIMRPGMCITDYPSRMVYTRPQW